MLTCFLHVPLFLYTIMSLPYHHRRGKKIWNEGVVWMDLPTDQASVLRYVNK
jgi:hypothetical protein